MPDLTGRVVVVTGGNGGIGFWTVQHLARRNARVVLACRSQARAETAAVTIRAEVPAADLDVVELDLSDLASVGRAAKELGSRYDRLDVLVNNAGIALVPHARTTDGFESQLGTNFLGHFALTGLLVDQLTATPGSRVVHVGSLSHRFARVRFDDLHFERRRYRSFGAYGQSKLANLLFMLELQRRLAAAGSPTISVGSHPGASATGIMDTHRALRVPGARPAAEWAGRAFFNAPEDGAAASVFAATEPGVAGGVYYGPGGFSEIKGPVRPARVAKRARSEGDAARLWSLAEELTGVRFLSR